MKHIMLFEEYADINSTNKLAVLVRSNYAEFVKKLGDEINDPKILAAMKVGRHDGDRDDEQIIFHEPSFSNVKDLIPTQNEIDVDKSMKFPLTESNPENLKKILNGQGVKIKTPVVILNEKYIIDGHHRWSSVYCMNDEGKIETMNMQTPEKVNPLRILKAVQMAIAASMGEVPTSVVKGENLLKMTERNCKAYVEKEMSDEVLSVFKETEKLNSKQSVADLIWENVKSMQTNNKPIPNAPDRSVMPQTDKDKTEKWKDFLQRGDVNFLPKFKDKTKTHTES